MLRTIIKRSCAALLAGSILFLTPVPHPADAHTLSDDPSPGYNPANLISNDYFTAYGLDGAGVNDFLRAKGSWLYGYGIPEYQDVPFKYRDGSGNCAWSSTRVRQYVTSSGELLYGTSAGDLLAKKSHDHRINPQVLIVTLEKEASAVTRSSPQSNPVEMWVLGYGWNDTMAACGYDFETAKKRAEDFGGVGQQIAYSAYGLRRLYDLSASDWNETLKTNDDQFVKPENQATRALYRYTPYVHNGNHNFWRLFTLWFRDVAVSYNPALVRYVDGTIYIADEGQLWHIRTADAFNAWGFSWNNVISHSGSPYANYPVVGGVNRLIRTSWGRVFYIENGKKRPIMSPRIFNAYGFNWNDVTQINDEIIKKIPTGIPMWELTRMSGTATVYFQSRGENHPIPNPLIFKDGWGFDWAEVADVPSYVVNQFPTTQPISRLAKSNQNVIFFLDHGVKYQIPDPDMFNRHGFKWSDVVAVESSFLDNFPTQGTLRGLVKAPDGRIFYIENGSKRYVSSTVMKRRGFNANDAVLIDWPGLDLFPNGSNL